MHAVKTYETRKNPPTHTHTRTYTQRAHTVPVHLTKPLASWKRLIWAPAASNHPIRDRVISTLLRLSEPSVQVPPFPRRWQDGAVFRVSCRSLWAHPEGLCLAWILQHFSGVNWTTVHQKCTIFKQSQISYISFLFGCDWRPPTPQYNLSHMMPCRCPERSPIPF